MSPVHEPSEEPTETPQLDEAPNQNEVDQNEIVEDGTSDQELYEKTTPEHKPQEDDDPTPPQQIIESHEIMDFGGEYQR